jgi:PhnB protein
VKGGTAAIEFYKRAFGARELYRLDGEAGKIAHAELELNGSVLTLADEYPEYHFVGPKTLGGTPCCLSLYVDDVDAFAARASAAGAEIERPVRDEFYGDRVVNLRDPFGHRWSIHTRKEVLTEAQVRERFAKLTAGG